MPILFRDRDGNDIPTCRECGSAAVAGTCSNCGYVAGQHLLAARMGLEFDAPLGILLDEARDEGYEAGRREAESAVIHGLAELARMDRVPCRHYRECSCREVLDREQVMAQVQAIKRALAGKL